MKSGKKLFLNRRAESDISARKIIFYILSSFLLVAVFFIILWINYSNKARISEMPIELENYLAIQRFFSSPYCFALSDKAFGRVYQIVDSQKFSQETLNRCYNAMDTKVKSYRLTLSYDGKKTAISTKNWEGFFKKAETKEVFVHDGTKVLPGELLIEAQDAK